MNQNNQMVIYGSDKDVEERKFYDKVNKGTVNLCTNVLI